MSEIAPASTLLAAVRAAHFAALVLVFGQFVFALAVAPPGPPDPGRLRTAAWALAAALASALAWLALEAANMSGLPLRQALGEGTLRTVLTETLFGNVWLARIVIGAALACLLPSLRGGGSRLHWGGALAAALLVTIAGTGHAAADRGIDRAIHLGFDTVHLAAAGAWVGSLAPLAMYLRHAQPGEAAGVLRRFSVLGIAAVAALLLSGFGNACYTVGSVAALFHSRYGALLSVKLLLFLVMLALAAVNRQRLTPRASDPAALPMLRRNALLELALGLLVIAIVGELGITVPAAHSH